MSETAPAGERPFLPAMGHGMPIACYDAFSRLVGARAVHWQLVAQAGLAPEHTVLEVGTGTGEVLLLAARVAPTATLVGLDPDPAVLDVARRKAERRGVTLHLERGYADRLPQPDSSVDRVLSSFMFHHLPPDQQRAMLAEVRRVLVPGGSLHLVDPDGTDSGLIGLFRRHGGGHGHGQGQGHGQAHGQGHGPGEGAEELDLHLVAAADVATMLREAGFTEVDAVAHRSRLLGRIVFHRAVAPR